MRTLTGYLILSLLFNLLCSITLFITQDMVNCIRLAILQLGSAKMAEQSEEKKQKTINGDYYVP